MSFVSESKQKVAFVGRSGEGKSTIAQLLTRLMDPDEGKITIDGQDIRDVTVSSLRRLFTYVRQETEVFDDSIVKNIRMAKENVSMVKVEEVCKMACMDVDVQALPDRYNTVVGENGKMLSGGQRQRLGIAQGLIRDSPIVILDEATSALDSLTETHIQRNIEEYCHDRTVVAIAHRLGTIQDADIIFVIGQGKILEEGNHETLLLRKGIYSDL